jgi:hypothetical protein
MYLDPEIRKYLGAFFKGMFVFMVVCAIANLIWELFWWLAKDTFWF